MKQVMFIGDIHGQPEWIEYATEAIKSGIEVVFLGDYVDAFHQTGIQIEQNLLRIIAFKRKADKRKSFISQVTLLLGNHDYSYLMNKFNVSGYDAGWAHRWKEIFDENWDIFNIAWGYTDVMTKEYTLATHAGITETYWNKYILNKEEPHYEFVQKILGEDAFEKYPMHKILNILKDKFGLLWKIGSDRGGVGTPGVLWADIKELKEDYYPGINQIVGHSAWHSQEFIRHKDNTFIAKVDGWGEVQRLILTI